MVAPLIFPLAVYLASTCHLCSTHVMWFLVLLRDTHMQIILPLDVVAHACKSSVSLSILSGIHDII